MTLFIDIYSQLKKSGPLMIDNKKYLFAQVSSNDRNQCPDQSIYVINGIIENIDSENIIAIINEQNWVKKNDHHNKEMYNYCKYIKKALKDYGIKNSAIEKLYNLHCLNKLNSDVNCPHTKRLLNLLSRNDIICGLRIYRLFKIVNEIIKTYYLPISHDEVVRASKILKIETDHLNHILKNDSQISKRLNYKAITGPGRKNEWPDILFMVYFRKRLESENVKSRSFSIPSIYYFLNEQARLNYLETRSIYSKIKSYQSGEGLKKLKDAYNECQRQYISLINEYSDDGIMTGVKAVRTIAVNHFQTKRDRLFPDWEDIIG